MPHVAGRSSDPQYPVRNEALHVWKSVVHNTPKTLGQILPTLMAQVNQVAVARVVSCKKCLAAHIWLLLSPMAWSELSTSISDLGSCSATITFLTRLAPAFGSWDLNRRAARRMITITLIIKSAWLS